MKRLLFFTVLLLGGIAQGQVLAPVAHEKSLDTSQKQTFEQQLSPDREEVWNGERKYFRYLQERNLKGFLSLWDDNFAGWPDYSDHPVGKRDIEAGMMEEFQSAKTPSPPIPSPNPEALVIFGNVAVTHYFWPEADETSPTKYRVTHTWQKGKEGWHIIGGMDCEVPRSAPVKSATDDHQQSSTKSDDQAAVEATVRGYEEAVQVFDFARADSLLAPNARWIERSAPETAAFGEGAGFWAEAKATRVRVRNEPRDFDVHLQGEMAWVTLLVDVTMETDNERARELLARSEIEETGKEGDPNQREWRATYAESEILVKTPSGWRIALGHTSRLPAKLK